MMIPTNKVSRFSKFSPVKESTLMKEVEIDMVNEGLLSLEKKNDDVEMDYLFLRKAIFHRWYTLTSFSYLCFLQCLVWFTFSSIPVNTKEYYGSDYMDDATIDLLLNWGSIAVLPAVAWASWLLTKTDGLRKTILWGSTLTCAGAIVRTIPCFLDIEKRGSFFSICLLHIGQILNSIAGACVMASPSQLSAQWFPKSQWTISTSISTGSNSIGTPIAFLLGPYIAPTSDGVPRLLYLHVIVCLVHLISILIYFPKPYTKAISYEQEVRPSYSFQVEIKNAFRNFNLMNLAASSSLQSGVTCAWCGVLQRILAPLGYSEKEVGFYGFVNTLTWVAGSLLTGCLSAACCQKDLKFVIFFSLFMSSIFWIIFTLGFPTPFFLPLYRPTSGVISALLMLASFFQGATNPLFYVLAAQQSYPIPEAISAGVLSFAVNLVIVVTLTLCHYVDIVYMNTLNAIAVVISCLLVAPLWRHPKNS